MALTFCIDWTRAVSHNSSTPQACYSLQCITASMTRRNWSAWVELKRLDFDESGENPSTCADSLYRTLASIREEMTQRTITPMISVSVANTGELVTAGSPPIWPEIVSNPQICQYWQPRLNTLSSSSPHVCVASPKDSVAIV